MSVLPALALASVLPASVSASAFTRATAIHVKHNIISGKPISCVGVGTFTPQSAALK